MRDYILFGTLFVGLIASVLYGGFAFAIHQVEENKIPRAWAPWLHQVWFNFFGSATGWAALFVLFYKFVPSRWGDPIPDCSPFPRR